VATGLFDAERSAGIAAGFAPTTGKRLLEPLTSLVRRTSMSGSPRPGPVP
jgi:hypothetical protein